MNKIIGLSFVLLSVLIMGSSAQLVWTGAVDSDVTNDANWSGGSVTGILDLTLAEDLVFGNAGTAPIGPERALQPSWGVTVANSITVDNVFLDTAGNDGLGAGTINVINGGSIRMFFLKSASINVDGDSSVNLLGGGDPLPNNLEVIAALHLAPGAQATLASLAEFTEQGAQIFVNGVSFADDTSILTFSGSTATAIPEPATLGMLVVFGGATLFIRRKMMV